MKLVELKKLKLPDSPGVYYFLGNRGEVLYVGRATSLKDRVRSYFGKDLARQRGLIVSRMVERARTLKFKKTDSVLEAVTLEAREIKKFQPPANTEEKDDKSFNYVVITKEKYPRVLLSRGKDLAERFPPKTRKYIIGPFPQGGVLKEAMRLVRKIFPFRDSCTPAEEQKDRPRGCFNSQIGLCPGVCSGAMSRADYSKRIRDLISFFEGKKLGVTRSMKKEMSTLAKAHRFEEAAEVKKRLFALSHIEDVSLLKDTYQGERVVDAFRIEAYDVAHISGANMVGVVVTLENGKIDRSGYRKFKLKTVWSPNDPAALREILERRLRHREWPMPSLVVVDGNIIQRQVAEKVLEKIRIRVPVVSVVKDEKHRPERVEGELALVKGHYKSIILANQEAHRFAIKYHRFLRGRRFLVDKSL